MANDEKGIRIVFMGTPKAAADVLDKLITAGKEIVAVITQPDKPRGRGLKTVPCETATVGADNHLRLFKPVSVKDPGFIKEISDINPDLVVVVAYGRILPKEFLDIPKYGCINVHASLLPKYRGASPIQAALLNGDKETGVTIFELNEKMDEGDIIAQEKLAIDEEDTAQTLSDKLFDLGGKMMINMMDQIEQHVGAHHDAPFGIQRLKQDNSKASYCKIIRKQDGKIDFRKPARDIVNMIRAFTPWPGAVASFKGKKVKLLSAKAVPDPSEGRSPGEVMTVVKGEGFTVRTAEGALFVTKVQPENSKSMDASAFIQGYRVEEGDLFEIL